MAGKPERERGRELYRFLETCQRREGRFPTYREIADALGWKSTNSVSYHVRRLVEEGLLEKEQGRARSFRLKRYRRSRFLRRQTVELEVHRGGREAGPTGRTIWIDSGWFQGRSLQAWEIQGRGSLPWGLVGGDCLVVDRAVEPDSGDLALVLVGGDLIVGRAFLEDGRLRLLITEEPEVVLNLAEGSFPGDLVGRVVGTLRRHSP